MPELFSGICGIVFAAYLEIWKGPFQLIVNSDAGTLTDMTLISCNLPDCLECLLWAIWIYAFSLGFTNVACNRILIYLPGTRHYSHIRIKFQWVAHKYESKSVCKLLGMLTIILEKSIANTSATTAALGVWINEWKSLPNIWVWDWVHCPPSRSWEKALERRISSWTKENISKLKLKCRNNPNPVVFSVLMSCWPYLINRKNREKTKNQKLYEST